MITGRFDSVSPLQLHLAEDYEDQEACPKLSVDDDVSYLISGRSDWHNPIKQLNRVARKIKVAILMTPEQ